MRPSSLCLAVAALSVVSATWNVNPKKEQAVLQLEHHARPPMSLEATAQCAHPPSLKCKKKIDCEEESCKGHILVTGGTGFIGSHTVTELLTSGYKVTIIDNLINSSPQSLEHVKNLTNASSDSVQLVLADIRDGPALRRVFDSCGHFDAVIHFAGLKAVGESVGEPLVYTDNNVDGTLNLLAFMREYGTKRIVFSSSATVYGTAEPPFKEDSITGVGITNPYGQTKYDIEKILMELPHAKDGDEWQVVVLRYFNPVGAHPSGLIGEQPNGIPNNLMPYVAQVATGKREKLTIFGDDYDTRDGTGERDYIHVVDLAKGHISALNFMKTEKAPTMEVFNLGTGNAVSVKELVASFVKACDCEIPTVMGERRPGDLPITYAVPEKANSVLGWKAEKSIDDMTRDVWNWLQTTKGGFAPCEVTRTGFLYNLE
mmetsp:Transcript_24158/g.42745  ORF Transcript_24158/g.42745 Transcript_24158/m.42745 type:complete len:429 (-) Transcript_24158:463-1749(-)